MDALDAGLANDAALARAAQHGDRSSLGRLFERYRPQLYASALRLVGYTGEAEDAVQDTFVTAFTQLSRLRDPAAAGGWLHSILKNRCLMELRRRRSRVPATDADLHLRRIPDEDRLDQQIESRELREWVWAALARLPDDQRLTMLLRYFGSYSSYDEVARMLGVPVGTVRSRLAEGRRKLAMGLGEQTESGESETAVLTAQRWAFYRDAFRSLFLAGNREKFLDHYAPDLQLVPNGGPLLVGREHLAAEVDEDLGAGVKLSPQRVLASGSLTVIEGVFQNPPEDPLHCPPGFALALWHERGRTVRMHLHLAPRPPHPATA